MRFSDDDRVTVTDPSDRWYGETGFVDGWHYGLARGVVYWVWLDGRTDSQIPYTEDQLMLGDNIYARSE